MPRQLYDRAASTSPFLATAIEIGERLVRDAQLVDGEVGWDGDDLLGTDVANLQVVRGPIGADLYGGMAGIAWFLGHLAATTDSTTFANIALASLRTALSHTAALVKQGSLSLYSGATGVVLAAIEVADRLALPDLAQEATALAAEIALAAKKSAPAGEPDLIAGLSGVIIGLLAVHRRHPDPVLLETCRFLCEHLAATANHDWWGTSWTNGDTAPALCGLGHGMAGMGWSLTETAWETEDDTLRALAQDAFRYERSFFSPDYGAWPDLRGVAERENAPLSNWMNAWCHGAIGIGAVRLRVYETSGDLSALADASAALQTARAMCVQIARDLQRGDARDVTLCHGIGGIAELFLLAGEVFGTEEHIRAARRVGELMQKIRATNGGDWPFGLPDTHDIPGLFLGRAGIGVTMLRLDDPASIGSPLLAGRRPPSPAIRNTPPSF